MKVVFKEPHKNAECIEVKDFDEMKRRIIPNTEPNESMVQAVPIFMDYWLLCDEEARLKEPEPDVNISVDFIVGNTVLGNVIICGESHNDFSGVNEKHVDNIIKWLNERSV